MANEVLKVPDFYKGQDIFITGGSGFMGKVLIEKLLRSCSGLNKIFVLLRPKKGNTPEERLQKIINLALFDVLRSTDPSAFEKLVAIDGDVTMINLGLSQNSLDMIKNVSIVFHAAASVRFDDPLREAIILNTRGTREVMKIANTLRHIKVVVHVSTTYCNPDKQVIYEKLYPPYANWEDSIKIAEKFDTTTLNILNDKYGNSQPNTYTFTKSMAEHIANDFSDRLPVVIFRPSIVISSIADPVSGWIDNFNGPVGMLVASGIGILRTMYGDPNVVSDFTPVDIAIRALITAAARRGTDPKRLNNLTIYNCSTSSLRAVTTGEIIAIGKAIVKEKPFEKTLWIAGGYITKCRIYNYIKFMLFHVLVACAVDSILRATKHKPFLLKLQRRIYGANLALHYFATTNWTFDNERFMTLDEALEPSDKPAFGFIFYRNVNVRDFLEKAIVGARLYLLNEGYTNSVQATRRFCVIYYVDKIMKIAFWVFLFYLLFSYLKNLF